MRVTLKKKNFPLTPAIRDYIELKLVSPVKKLLERAAYQDLPLLEIEIARSSMHHRKGLVFYAEANLTLGKRLLRVEAESVDMYGAIDALKDELEGRIKSMKEKVSSVGRNRARVLKSKLREG